MQAAASQPSAACPETVGGSLRLPSSYKRVRTMKRSFAETAAAAPRFGDEVIMEEGDVEWFKDDISVESDDETEAMEGADGIPVVKIPKAVRKDLIEPWRNAIILKFLGKNVGFPLLLQKTRQLWNVKGKFELIDLGFNCYVARFELAKDCMHVLLDGPWKIYDHYIVPQRWKPDFDPSTAKLVKMAVWVRLPGLPVEYFREDIIKLILQQVGTPLHLDRATAGVERGKFARAAVEIDLAKPLVAMVKIRHRLQRIEFEGLHAICFQCGEVRHRSLNCPKNQSPSSEQPDQEVGTNHPNEHTMTETLHGKEGLEPKFGPWMLVQRRSRHTGSEARNNRMVKKPVPRVKESANLTNRFANLHMEMADINEGEIQLGESTQAVKQGKGKEVSIGAEQGKFSPPLNIPLTALNFPLQGIDKWHETPVRMEGERIPGVSRGDKVKSKGRISKASLQKASFGARDPSATMTPFDVGKETFVFGRVAEAAREPSLEAGSSQSRLVVGTQEESGGSISSSPDGFQ